MKINGFGSLPQPQQPQQSKQPQSKSNRKKQIRIPISFKEDELWLYEKLCEHSSPSAWIKDLLKMYYKQ
ncbi:hypothetical protein SDC9_185464 [bioreactor metagenome]|uniref:Uncharacterized protein n=1 Tax=bioreactor metagenome TaxID=1076179 RepID=A0A645HRE9_9ZZZZ|nr:hypothetical protein [Anaerotignum propionicum]MEA5057794.1 hypothetical protein [Anaerotignum propionicum]